MKIAFDNEHITRVASLLSGAELTQILSLLAPKSVPSTLQGFFDLYNDTRTRPPYRAPGRKPLSKDTKDFRVFSDELRSCLQTLGTEFEQEQRRRQGQARNRRQASASRRPRFADMDV